jgi:hypothetical protein
VVEHVEAVLPIGHIDHVDGNPMQLGRRCEGLDGRGGRSAEFSLPGCSM